MSHALAISSSLTSSPKELICTSHEAACYATFSSLQLPRLRPKYLLQHLILKHPQPLLIFNVSSKVTYPDKRTGEITVPYILTQNTLQKAWDLNGLPQLLMLLADDLRWRSVFSALHCTSTAHLSVPQG
jgi:hypothetical protein